MGHTSLYNQTTRSPLTYICVTKTRTIHLSGLETTGRVVAPFAANSKSNAMGPPFRPCPRACSPKPKRTGLNPLIMYLKSQFHHDILLQFIHSFVDVIKFAEGQCGQTEVFFVSRNVKTPFPVSPRCISFNGETNISSKQVRKLGVMVYSKFSLEAHINKYVKLQQQLYNIF